MLPDGFHINIGNFRPTGKNHKTQWKHRIRSNGSVQLLAKVFPKGNAKNITKTGKAAKNDFKSNISSLL